MTVRPQDIALRRASVETGFEITAPAFPLVHPNVNLSVDIEFIQRQFVFYFHSAFLAFIASVITCQRPTLPFIASLRTLKVLLRGLPSLWKMLRIIPQASSG